MGVFLLEYIIYSGICCTCIWDTPISTTNKHETCAPPSWYLERLIVYHLFCIHSDTTIGNNITMLSLVPYPVFLFLLPSPPCVSSLVPSRLSQAQFFVSLTLVSLNPWAICLLLLQFSAYCATFSINSVSYAYHF